MSDREGRARADRLCAAAEAVLQAVRELSADAPGERRVADYPPDLMGTPHQPACLGGYSKAEIAQATHFLIRLGVLARSTRDR